MSNNHSHDQDLENICRKPHIFGIHGERIVAKEVQLYDHFGRLIGESDVIIIQPELICHNFENKSHDSNKQYDKAKKQLRKTGEYLAGYGFNVTNYYTHDNLQFKIMP